MSRNFTVDGVLLPVPNISYGLQDIHSPDSGRTLSATAEIKIVARKEKIDCSWANVPDSIATLILSNVKSQTYYMVNYPDPKVGGNATYEFYTGDCTSDLVSILDDVCYWNIKCPFIRR